MSTDHGELNEATLRRWLERTGESAQVIEEAVTAWRQGGPPADKIVKSVLRKLQTLPMTKPATCGSGKA